MQKLIITIAAVLSASLICMAQSINTDLRSSPISLDFNYMTTDVQGEITINKLRGNVVASNSDYTITTESADYYINKKYELLKIICMGNVNFKSKSMDMLAVADNAEMDHLKQILTLTGNVEVHQPDRNMKAEKLVINYGTGQIMAGEATGGSRVNIIINSFEGLNPGDSE